MSANKAKGTRHETAVVNYLNETLRRVLPGTKVYKPRQEGFRDVGDIHGVSPWIIQAKNWASWEAAIREGIDGAEKQKKHAGEPYGMAVVHRARRNVRQAYAVQTLETWAHAYARMKLAESMLTDEQREQLQQALLNLESD